jgi:hypothetical protein
LTVAYIDWLPVNWAPRTIAFMPLVLTICWPQRTPSSSAWTMKHSTTLTGWPCTPPSSALIIRTAALATSVTCGNVAFGGPPWVLTQPRTTGDRFAFALPLPPT